MRAIDLSHEAARDPDTVGHKAATLARFAATFRVPPAFCLATSVYDELHAAAVGDAIARASLARLVAEGYGRLAAQIGTPEPAVAVRSSATGEDSVDASFAGQHETILMVRGADRVTEAVIACWRSAGNERVTAYRKQRGIIEPARVAVLVQQMVPADISAIAFGIDPVSGDAEVVVIDAAAGLGDRIASGEITPDRYTVRKADLAVTGPPHGALDDHAAREVAKLTLALERANAHPVDVECAFAGGELYLLQCRPITTLGTDFPIEWREPGDAALHWRRDDAHFAGPVPHLVQDYIQDAAAHGMRARNERFAVGVRPRFEAFNGRQFLAQQPLVPPDELAERMRANAGARRAHSRDLGRLWREEYLPRLREHYAWMRSHDLAALPFGALADLWEAFWPRVRDTWDMHMMVTGGAYAVMDELVEVYERLVGGSALDAYRLTQGRATSLQRLERDLHELGLLAARSTAPSGTLERATSLADVRAADAALGDAIAAFLDVHGNLGHAGEDMRHLPWSDEPATLFADVARRAADPRPDPGAREARLVAEGDAIEARAVATLRERPDDLATFREVLAAARESGPLTEEHNYHLDRQIQAHAARIFAWIGRRLAGEGLVASADDIYFLRKDEIGATLRARIDRRALVTERRAEFSRWERMRAPTTAGAPAPAGPSVARADLMLRVRQDDDSVIKGVPASAGLRRGRVRIVRGTGDFAKLAAGEILVCRSSNVSWIPLFTIAGAVVTDIGGALSHAAVVAREFGVPAVAGCSVALERLRNGQLVEVDGDRGLVRPLD